LGILPFPNSSPLRAILPKDHQHILRPYCGLVAILTLICVSAHSSADVIGFWAFNEGGGTTAVDSSGNGNTGTFGVSSYTAGQSGGVGDTALNVLGGGQTVTIAPGGFSSIGTTNQVTLSMWIFGNAAEQPRTNTTVEGLNGGNRIVFTHSPWVDGRIYWDSGNAGCCGGNVRTNTAPLSPTLYEGQWNHYALVKNGVTNFSGIYINGTLVASNATGSTANLSGLTSLTLARDYRGFLDDIAIYNNAISADSITAMATGQLSGGVTYADSLVGSNGYTKMGAGTATLTAENLYQGSTNVTGGTLSIGNGGTTGSILASSDVSVSGTGVVQWNNANDTALHTIANDLSGNGIVRLQGQNDVGAGLQRSLYDLTGDNSGFTGTLEINRAILWQNFSQSDVGSSTIDVQDRGTVAFNNGGLFTNDIIVSQDAGWHHNVSGNDVVLGAIRLEGNNTLTGNIVLNNTASIVNGDNSGANSTVGAYTAGNHTLSGVISGVGDFSMSRFTSWNGGAVQAVNIDLVGNSSNTYTGKTVVDGQGAVASLRLGKTGGAVAIQGGTVVQIGSMTGGQANLRMLGNEQFGTNSGGVEMNFVNSAGNWGRFDLLGTTQTLAGINTGTSTVLGSGVVQNGGVGIGAAGQATLTLNGSGNYLFNGHIRNQDNVGSGALNLIKAGTGTQTLVGNRITYTGSTTVNNGTLELLNTTGFNSATEVNSGGTLELSNTANMSIGAGFTVDLNNGGTLTHSGMTNGNDYLVLGGAVTNSGATTINQNSVTNTTGSSKSLFLDGGLKGSGTVTINALNSGNAVVLRNSNTDFSGRLIVNGIASATPNAGSGIAVGGATTGLINADIELNGTMELLNQGIGWAATAPGDFWMGALDGNGVMVGNFTANGQTRVRIGNTNNDGSFSGSIVDGIGNQIVLTKNGTGRQVFSGANTYSGFTLVNDGVLELAAGGSLQNSTVTVNSGAEFHQSGGANNITSLGANPHLSISTGAAYTLDGGVLDFQDTANGTQLTAAGTESSLNVASGGAFNFNNGTLMNVTNIVMQGGATFTQTDGEFIVGVDGVNTAMNPVQAFTSIDGGFSQTGGILRLDVFGPNGGSYSGGPQGPSDPDFQADIDILTASLDVFVDGELAIDFNGTEPIPWVWYDAIRSETGEITVGSNFFTSGLTSGGDGTLWRVIDNPFGPGQILQIATPEPGSIAVWTLLAITAGFFKWRRNRKTR
jgi:autotransporter-associated beta strand protein